ncbi:MAG: hypothetical protein Q8P86_02540 [bacterium]|nr:hypothetical protein [bacterium]
MTSITFTIKPRRKTASSRNRKIVVEMDANRLERLAADFGMLNPDFLKTIEQSEQDYKAGRFRKVKSLNALIK